MNLDSLNSLASVGIGVNLVFALFEGIIVKFPNVIDDSFKDAIKQVENAIAEYNSAKDNLNKQLVEAQQIIQLLTIYQISFLCPLHPSKTF